MHARTRCFVILVAILGIAGARPSAAQNPWTSQGGYFEQFDAPPGPFVTHTMRWLWSSRFAFGVPDDFIAWFRCWRSDADGGIGNNKFIVQWTITGNDSDTVMKFPKWRKKIKDGYFDGVAKRINGIAPLTAESSLLVEAKIKVKGSIGAGEYVGCDMDLSEHPDGWDGTFEMPVRHRD